MAHDHSPRRGARLLGVPSLGFLPPILGSIQAGALIVVAMLLWRVHLGGTWSPWAFVPVMLLSFIPYFIAVYVCAHSHSATNARAILLFAILFRVILWATPPVLSDDIYRYVWEGRVQYAGFNPYVHAPNAGELEAVRAAGNERLHENVNHAHVPAIYPALSQILFWAMAWFPAPVALFKFFFGAIDVLNVWLLICILRQRKLPPQFALIYAWNPLPAIEFAGSGHLLSLAICLFLLAYFAALRDRQIVGAIAAGLAFGTHFLIVAPLLHIYNALQKKWLPVIGIVLAVLYLPYLSAGVHLLDGLTHYSAAWKFNDSLFGLLVQIFGDSHRPVLESGAHLAHRWPKIIAGLLFAVTALGFIFREKDWLRAGYVMTGLLLLLMPTVHPWYVTLILPFLCFYRNLGWLAFTALVTISYSAVAVLQMTGEWSALTLFPTHERLELIFLAWLEYAPFFVLWIWSALRIDEPLHDTR